MPDPNKYKPTDAFSRLNAFLSEILKPDDMSQAETLIEELARELTGETAGSPLATDAMMRRRVVQGVARARVGHDADFRARFPGAGRLRETF